MTDTPVPSGECSRRSFIAAALSGAVVPLTRNSAEPGGTPSPAVCIHVFSKPLQWLSYEDAAGLLAEVGFGGIDYSVRPGGHVVPERVVDDLPRAVECAHKAGLKVDMITTAIVDPADKFTEPILATASKLGVKYYRLGSIAYDPNLGVWGTLQKYKPVFKDLAQLNQKHGIHGAYQNHAGARVGGPVWDLFELLRDLDPRWMGCQYDVRHAVVEGGTSWPLGFQLVRPWIKSSDIKDFKWSLTGGRWSPESVPIGEGMVDFDRYFKAVRESNLTGPISVHFEYPPFERLQQPLADSEKRAVFAAAMKKDLSALKGYLTKYQIA